MYNQQKFNKKFDCTEADSPIDLYKILKSSHDPLIGGMRCWVFMVTDASSVWVEIPNIPGYFEKVAEIGCFKEDEILVEFRDKNLPSPNSSPNGSPSKEQHRWRADFGSDSKLVNIGTGNTQHSWSDANTTWNATTVDLNEVINDKDPFTLVDVAEMEDPLLRRFPPTKSSGPAILCVSYSSFESFVKNEAKAGRNVTTLEIKWVVCKGGRKPTFSVSNYVWMKSVLKNSQALRNMFSITFLVRSCVRTSCRC
jgi:hypothetical protein